MKFFWGFVLTIVCSVPLQSQVLTGTITSSKNSTEVVDFVNIGIKGKSFGTVSDEKGNYTFDVSGKPDSDTVVFSHLGYQPFVCTVGELRNKSANHRFNPTLEEKRTTLREVVVRVKRTKVRWLGSEPSNAFRGNFFEDKLGCEMGTIFRFDGKRGVLKKASIKIAQSSYDSLYFRVNVYSLKNGMPDENILQQPVYYKGQGQYPKGTVLSIDLSEQYILVDQDFVVSFEWIKDLGKGGLDFPFTLLRKNAVSKNASQDNWTKKSFGIGIKAEVEIEK